MKIPAYDSKIPTGNSGGGSAGIHPAEKDRRRGLKPGAGTGGTAGQVPGMAVESDRANVAVDRVDLQPGAPRIKRVK